LLAIDDQKDENGKGAIIPSEETVKMPLTNRFQDHCLSILAKKLLQARSRQFCKILS